MTFEAKKSITLISKSGCPNLHALKINKQQSEMTTTASGFYIVLSYINLIYLSPDLFRK